MQQDKCLTLTVFDSLLNLSHVLPIAVKTKPQRLCRGQVAREELQPHDEEIFEKERCRAWLVFVPPLGGGPSIHLRNTEAFPLARW